MTLDSDTRADLLDEIRQTWGYDSFRPLQEEVMAAVLARRDSLVVLPTGGGKSLCYQAPALIGEGWSLVVSPLISLMKDQVDSLVANGVPAACVHSAITPEERKRAGDLLRSGRLKLLYVSPERLVQVRFLTYLRKNPPRFVAIDEAHCISLWGHDFRPEYRRLRRIKELLPEVNVHAFTATATARVREDIVDQLGLDAPEIVVGPFDRPNLVYRVRRRRDVLAQVLEVVERHRERPGIVYCIRRRDVDDLAARLRARGVRALPYHAGLAEEERIANQEAFVRDEVDVIVATVAFGMGIDKPDVRFVIHAGMPKSIEHYLQESGRAGRDGLESECVLLHADSDVALWQRIFEYAEQENGESGGASEAHETAVAQLYAMRDFCRGVTCRHKALVTHFGQAYDQPSCDACDICLGEVESMEDPSTVVQAVLDAVVGMDSRFGTDFVSKVLVGSRDKRVLDFHQDQRPAYGLLRNYRQQDVRDWIEQLVESGCLEKVGEYRTLALTELGRRVRDGDEPAPRLLAPAKPARRSRKAARITKSYAGEVDEGLFEALRDLRKRIADRRHVPPFVVFHDTSLRDMAARRPSTEAGFLSLQGVGTTKARHFGQEFLDEIRSWCYNHGLDTDVE